MLRKGALTSACPLPSLGWEAGLGGEPKAEPQGALCLSRSRGPPEALEAALGSQRPSSSPPNSQVSTQGFSAGGAVLTPPLSPGTPAQA